MTEPAVERHQGRPTTATADYDPTYDPLTTPHPGHGREYAPTYWVATAGEPPADDGPVQSDLDVDVAIIGSGFTGLSAALFLAREHGIKATVLEANRTAWGCTSRNGGQALNASGRLSRSQWIKRYGKEVAIQLHAEIAAGFDTFRELIKDVDCDAQHGGHLYIAHRDRAMRGLGAEARVLENVFGYKVELLDRKALAERYVDEAEAVGAMHEPDGIGVHPLKLAYGYLRQARELGATVHPASPVTGWHTRNGVHHLHTPRGIVRARAVGVATGGYTAQQLHPALRNRFYPVMSNSLVTRPLTAEEKQACNFITNEIITDTRTLRFYYRKLPDDRVQIGSRSAIAGADATHPRHRQLLVDGLRRKFPALAGIDVDYYWWGWVDLSHDMMPRVFRPDPNDSIYYALGYGGNGVMYSAQAGKRLAQWIAGKPEKTDLPIFCSELPSHPLAPFRRLGQSLLYRWYQLRDEKF
ncbi:taurine dehydrogenase large subunit [Natronocella acetinitrilica]|uniref:Taurine dehydrogenase large subunit n=1 Tax=Natronocella acetinitrilica TaxID=414046 RepID=A0AAE3KG80_9GAMM|nr:FAD-binding oxidoreductase [Natronocella acetinitrilica]MCP1674932.1 taurine dehydrogenase large subunit [Natronocella acetinitrilica]